eukprot:m.474963 g.474963  ORF g.474963 m.474963 type:complete len:499 (-) comp37256_c0_seq1:48-1544(-)
MLSCVAMRVPVRAQDPTEPDRTLWLPDELLMIIFQCLLVASLIRSRCDLVCRRWHALLKTPTMRKRVFVNRWGAYTSPMSHHRLHRRPPPLFVPDTRQMILGRLPNGSIGLCRPKTLSLPRGAPLPDELRIEDSELGVKLFQSTVEEFPGVLQPKVIRSHTGTVNAMAMSIDGILYSASSDMTIQVWCARTTELIRTLTGHRAEVRSLAVAPDGTLYSASNDAQLLVWSQSGRILHRVWLRDDWGFIRCTPFPYVMKVGPCGTFYCSVKGEPGHHQILALCPGREPCTRSPKFALEGHRWLVLDLAFHPEDGTVFSTGSDNTVCGWAPDNGRLLWRVATNDVVTCLTFARGTLLGGAGGGLYVIRTSPDVGEVDWEYCPEGSADTTTAIASHGDLVFLRDEPEHLSEITLAQLESFDDFEASTDAADPDDAKPVVHVPPMTFASIRLWSIQYLECICDVKIQVPDTRCGTTPKFPCHTFVFSPEGRLFTACGRRILVW